MTAAQTDGGNEKEYTNNTSILRVYAYVSHERYVGVCIHCLLHLPYLITYRRPQMMGLREGGGEGGQSKTASRPWGLLALLLMVYKERQR